MRIVRRICLLTLWGALFSSLAHAERQVPGLLFRGGTAVSPPDVEVSPQLPRGHRVGWEGRPTDLPYLCSLSHPLCVHGAQPSQREAALRELETVYDDWIYVMRMPTPMLDGGLGGGPEFDIYLLSDELTSDDSPLQIHSDAPTLGDAAASVSCHLQPYALTERWFRLCLAEATAARLDAAAGPGVRRGWAQYQASLLSGFDEDILRSIDDAQSNPQLGVVRREQSLVADAGLLFWAYVDRSLGIAEPGRLPFAVLSLSQSRAAAETLHPEWNNEPDVMDVLRRAFDNDAQRVADFVAGFAVSRMFLGGRADNAHAPGLAELGTWGRVRFDWVLPYSSLPRYVAGAHHLEPLGAAYVWLDLDSVPLTARLAFRAEWEEPVRFKWTVVSVDAQGREMNRWDVPYLERGNSVEKTLMNFQGAAGLVFVGVNLGGVDLSHPFDPDHEPWESHAYSLYVTELP